jgi:hypothetical protein
MGPCFPSKTAQSCLQPLRPQTGGSNNRGHSKSIGPGLVHRLCTVSVDAGSNRAMRWHSQLRGRVGGGCDSGGALCESLCGTRVSFWLMHSDASVGRVPVGAIPTENQNLSDADFETRLPRTQGRDCRIPLRLGPCQPCAGRSPV